MKRMTVVSFGAGVQSTAVLIMSNLGLRDCPRADVAIFADTQSEPPWVYDTVERMREWSRIPVVTVSNGSLETDVVRRHRDGGRFAAIPAFTADERTGEPKILRRQCTREYKIDAITKEIRRRAGLRPRQWAKGRLHVTSLIGFSVDEVHRAAPSRNRWIENRWPLLDAGMDRHDCKLLIQENGLPIPKKSSCTVCPFHHDRYWIDLRDNHPSEWDRACAFDEAIRDMSMSGVKNPVFLHRSLVPLSEADLVGDGQLSMWGNECTGYCGV